MLYLVYAKQELEAWLLIDCVGIFCYFASKRAAYKDKCRKKIRQKSHLMNLINKHQRGNTALIVEAEMGGKGVKEYLVKFSEEILKAVNPNMRPKNIKRERYRERMTPEIAQFVEINDKTLKRNTSLKRLGQLLIRCNKKIFLAYRQTTIP